MMFAILLRRAKQVCAQRNREGGVVDLHGDERSGALAGSVPARTDLDSACSVAEEQPPFGGIFSRRRLRSNDGDRGIDGERVHAAGRKRVGWGVGGSERGERGGRGGIKNKQHESCGAYT